MFSNNDNVLRTTGAVEFDGTMKSYTNVCDLLGIEPVSNLWRWKAHIHDGVVTGSKTVMIVTTTEDGDTAIMAGDTVKLDHGEISVKRKGA